MINKIIDGDQHRLLQAELDRMTTYDLKRLKAEAAGVSILRELREAKRYRLSVWRRQWLGRLFDKIDKFIEELNQNES